VQQVQIHVIGLEPGQRIVQVGGDVKGRQPPAIFGMGRAFGDEGDLVAQAPRLHPPPDEALAVAAAVHVRRVNRIASRCVNLVQQRKALRFV
jgi:hypothetical protein